MIRTAVHTIGFLIAIVSIVLAKPVIISAQSYTCDIDHPDSLTCTFGATCNGCGVMSPYYSGGAANDWDCQWGPECLVVSAYNPAYNTVTCSTRYQFSEQCIASDVCCNANGTGPEVCYQSCGTGGCKKGYWYKTCCQTNGSYGTCDAIPLIRSCTLGTITGGTSCFGTQPTSTPGGPSPTPGGPTNTPVPVQVFGAQHMRRVRKLPRFAKKAEKQTLSIPTTFGMVISGSAVIFHWLVIISIGRAAVAAQLGLLATLNAQLWHRSLN